MVEFIDVNVIQDSQHQWGGTWTEKKLNAFAKYVIAYLTIMRKNPYWKTIYFDGFAGSGYRTHKITSDIFQRILLNEEEVKTYKGAAERVLTLPGNFYFNYYYFIDKHVKSLKKLEHKLAQLPINNERFIKYKEGDCNKYLFDLASAMKRNQRKYASLVLLDPFGMQINWESIASLSGTRTDIWILVPTGVIINRLLDRNGELKHSVKLQSFFGLPEDEIKKYFYKKDIVNTLFGEQELIHKITRPIEKISDLYIRQLKTIWKHVTEEPLRLENSRGVPIFHFVFASNNIHAVKIAKQIIQNV